MPDRSFFITTPIYYVNDVPHIGHAYTTVAGDALARFHRLRGERVFFLTGTDEHGRKVEKSAADAGLAPLALADRNVRRFQDLWGVLDISHDGFIRTTEQRHKKIVAELWTRVEAAGDIYLGVYEDWYCVPCESYWPEKELTEGACPQCRRPVEKLKEESYFFRMSKYQDALLRHIDAHPDFIQPLSRKNEIVSFVREGLRDLSVSRTTFSWGIPVPGNPKHVIYVWFDALANYLSGVMPAGAAGLADPAFLRVWPPDVHLIGKDILRFHAVYWPTFLLSAGLPLPARIFAHGWWTVNGEKMSKSLGNVVDPAALVGVYGADPVRYFLLREVPFGLDGDFSHPAMVTRFNSDLANDLGNLLNRTLGMLHRYQGGVVAPPGPPEEMDDRLREAALAAVRDTGTFMDEIAFSKMLSALWELVSRGNKYIDEAQPWAHAKTNNTARVKTIMYYCMEALRLIALLIYPVMPAAAKKIAAQMGIPGALDAAAAPEDWAWGRLAPGTKAGTPQPLFPRIETGPKEATMTSAPEHTPAPAAEKISVEDFKKVELRSARILSAERVSGSKKLIKLQVDIGVEKRQIVAGIGLAYAPESLVGRAIVIVANLAPVKLMGVESQGMLLAGGTEGTLTIVTLDGDIPPGTLIK